MCVFAGDGGAEFAIRRLLRRDVPQQLAELQVDAFALRLAEGRLQGRNRCAVDGPGQEVLAVADVAGGTVPDKARQELSQRTCCPGEGPRTPGAVSACVRVGMSRMALDGHAREPLEHEGLGPDEQVLAAEEPRGAWRKREHQAVVVRGRCQVVHMGPGRADQLERLSGEARCSRLEESPEAVDGQPVAREGGDTGTRV